MAEVPSNPQPPISNYLRSSSSYGTVEALKLVWSGYSGLNFVFMVSVAAALVANAVWPAGTQETYWSRMLAIAVVLFLLVTTLTFPQNKKIAQGCGWATGMEFVASILMGMNSALCCGVIGYVVVQQIAGKEIAKYGIARGFLGYRKADVEAKIAQLQTQQSTPGSPYPRP